MTLLLPSKPRHAAQVAVCQVCAELVTSHAASLEIAKSARRYRVVDIEMRQCFTCELVEKF